MVMTLVNKSKNENAIFSMPLKQTRHAFSLPTGAGGNV